MFATRKHYRTIPKITTTTTEQNWNNKKKRKIEQYTFTKPPLKCYFLFCSVICYYYHNFFFWFFRCILFCVHFLVLCVSCIKWVHMTKIENCISYEINRRISFPVCVCVERIGHCDQATVCCMCVTRAPYRNPMAHDFDRILFRIDLVIYHTRRHKAIKSNKLTDTDQLHSWLFTTTKAQHQHSC